MVCGRRVRVEHALTTGSKKVYNSYSARRYQHTISYIFLITALHTHIVRIVELSLV